ncbi:MAG: hypothetical protein ACD_80C00104G0001, partial [uncultured bacterium (gcode 4)]
HVGQVIGIPGDWMMIVKDMNYLGKFVVTTRYENISNRKISCYIY